MKYTHSKENRRQEEKKKTKTQLIKSKLFEHYIRLNI